MKTVRGFDWALREMRDGKKVSRHKWSKNAWLEITVWDNREHIRMGDSGIQWRPYQSDLVSDDWYVYSIKPET
jgi:hypothetical protein